jgi:hypothetical protein
MNTNTLDIDRRNFILVITDLGELDFYQAQAIVGARMVTHNILILQAIFA